MRRPRSIKHKEYPSGLASTALIRKREKSGCDRTGDIKRLNIPILVNQKSRTYDKNQLRRHERRNPETRWGTMATVWCLDRSRQRRLKLGLTCGASLIDHWRVISSIIANISERHVTQLRVYGTYMARRANIDGAAVFLFHHFDHNNPKPLSSLTSLSSLLSKSE